jgi:hypothetical protein
MKIQYIVIYFSMFFWIFPAVRQYKTELFWYFFVLAIHDPITALIWYLLKAKDPYETIIISFFLLLTVLWSLKSKKSIRILIAVTLSLLLFSLFSSMMTIFYMKILFHMTIIYFFTKRTFMFIANCGKVNIFHLFLLLEEISIVLKMLATLISSQSGLIYLVATNAFEILIAIFFTLYREDNPKLHIDLRNT